MSTPPSPFAALLRRSKFVSFDPCIGQVYTTHGGHAHRGNWGFKRPLPNRRRVGYITLRAVDSPEQQTEWSSAEASARWMKRWQEQGKSLNTRDGGMWTLIAKKTTSPDSEFNRAGKSDVEPIDQKGSLYDLPDVSAMNQKQFRKYLKRMRALRPEFKKFLAQYAQSAHKDSPHDKDQKLPSEKHERRDTLRLTGSGEVNMYASAAIGNEVHANRFLTKLREDELYAPESKALARQPHHFAGLEYTRISDLQAQYLHRPVRGRDVMQNHAGYSRGSRDINVDRVHYIAAGGIVGIMPSAAAGSLVPTDYGTQETPRRNREQGVSYFRMTRALLADPPTVVGREPEGIANTKPKTRGAHQGTTGSKMHIERITFWPVTQENTNRSNPYPLGSPAYVAKGSQNSQQLIPGRMLEITQRARDFRTPWKITQPRDHQHVLSETLGNLLQMSKQKGDGSNTLE